MKSYLILCGKLFDGIKDELQEKAEILISGNTIEAVGVTFRAAKTSKSST